MKTIKRKPLKPAVFPALGSWKFFDRFSFVFGELYDNFSLSIISFSLYLQKKELSFRVGQVGGILSLPVPRKYLKLPNEGNLSFEE